MKKIINFVLLAFMYVAISFVEYSFAYKESPTQPTILDLSNSTPTPNYSNCTLAFNACGAQNYSSFTDPIYLIDYCGDPSIYEIFSLTVGDPMFCAETEFSRAIDCKNCDCPSSQFRTQGMCVPDAGLYCVHGISNYLTGECYPATCPYGDGSPEDCHQTPQCLETENTTLIEANPARCECTGGLMWDADQEKCVAPACDGENNSPLDSIFDPEQGACVCPSTHELFANEAGSSCQRVSCENPNEVFVSSRAQCEVAVSCDNTTQTLITATNTCRQLINTNCGSIDQKISYYASFVTSAECYFPDRNIPISLPEGCYNVADPVQQAIERQYHQGQACGQCVSSGGIPYLFRDLLNPFATHYNSCKTPETLCDVYAGEWSDDLNVCLNANDDGIHSSASSMSNVSTSSSASTFSSASSASSINSGGGSGSSSGTNTSSGSGNGNGNGDGSGGNGTSAGSAASVGNNSSQGAGECDPEAKDYLECIAPDQSQLPSHTPTDSGLTSIDQVNQAFVNRVSNSPVVQGFRNFENIISVENAECPALSIDLLDIPPINSLLETDIHCQIFDNIRPIISVVMFAVFAFLGFRIFASA